MIELTETKEKAVLVFVWLGKENWEKQQIQMELEELCKTAGLDVVGQVEQNLAAPNNRTYIGSGKLEELQLLLVETEADCVVFEQMLTPAQLHRLAELLPVKVIDKTMLILDIFAQRARSHEGKLQVELAQANYLLPRLLGQGISMSRQGGSAKGGVGNRGPGETKLETDRRYLRRRITQIEQALKEVSRHRNVQQKQKLRQRIPLVALVGYTNAGKSSLLNCLTNENIYAENQLFATLDTTTRGLLLPNGTKALLTDTVGFIRDLPPQLINAFKSTLDELQYADLLLHVIDCSNPNYVHQIEVVEEILLELGVAEKQRIFVFNKIDLLEEIPPLPLSLAKENCCYVAAANGTQIDILLQLIESKIVTEQQLKMELPLTAGDILSRAYSIGKVEDLEYTEEHIRFVLTADQTHIPKDFWQYQQNGER